MNIPEYLLKNVSVRIIKNVWVDEIVGLENIKNEPSIVIANHSSYFDFLVLGAIYQYYKAPLYFWAKMKVVNHFIFRYYTKYCESIAIDSQNSTTFWKKSLEHLKDGKNIGIFPEGTRSRDGKINNFKLGYLKLATEASVPIQPVYLYNTYNILPPNKRIPNLKKCKIIIYPSFTLEKNISDKSELDIINNLVLQNYYNKI